MENPLSDEKKDFGSTKSKMAPHTERIPVSWLFIRNCGGQKTDDICQKKNIVISNFSILLNGSSKLKEKCRLYQVNKNREHALHRPAVQEITKEVLLAKMKPGSNLNPCKEIKHQ